MRSGDGFVQCGDGAVRWGRFGAAGVLFAHVTDGSVAVLMQHRSAWSHQGGTWSCPGGALDEGEAALDGALREASEELGATPTIVRVVGLHEFVPADDWRYTTFVVEVGDRGALTPNFESAALAWLSVDDVAARDLHPGFAAAWPALQALVVAM